MKERVDGDPLTTRPLLVIRFGGGRLRTWAPGVSAGRDRLVVGERGRESGRPGCRERGAEGPAGGAWPGRGGGGPDSRHARSAAYLATGNSCAAGHRRRDSVGGQQR